MRFVVDLPANHLGPGRQGEKGSQCSPGVPYPYNNFADTLGYAMWQ